MFLGLKTTNGSQNNHRPEQNPDHLGYGYSAINCHPAVASAFCLIRFQNICESLLCILPDKVLEHLRIIGLNADYQVGEVDGCKQMKPAPLQSAPPCHQMLVLEPCLCQGGGTKILGYGVRLPFLCDGREQFCSKISVSRFAMEIGAYALEKLNRGSKIRNSIMSQVFASTKISSSASADYSTQGEEEGEENDDADDELSYFRGLVLDVSYRPVNVVCWRRAICLEFLEKADVLEYYDQTVSSPGGSFNIPAVLRVANLVQVPKRRRVKAQLSRKNVYGRDLFTCQYCRSHDNLTIDHVLPASRGGHWNWENLVTACSECNSKKGHKTLEEANMKLIKIPKAPKDYDTQGIPLTYSTYKMLRNREKMPNEWLDYISTPFFVS